MYLMVIISGHIGLLTVACLADMAEAMNGKFPSYGCNLYCREALAEIGFGNICIEC